MKSFAKLVACVLLGGCSSPEEAAHERRPAQAGKPMSVAATVGNIAQARVSAAVGDRDGAKRAIDAMAEDYRKAIKLADPARSVDRESARSAARRVPGVRSVVWLDGTNLFAIVERNDLRSQATIDSICVELEPLGDTLGVVVNLQSGAATNGDDLEILQRNCQLAPGEHSLLQRPRKVDVIDPSVRAQHKANNGR